MQPPRRLMNRLTDLPSFEIFWQKHVFGDQQNSHVLRPARKINDFQSHQVIVELNWDIPSENIVQVVRSSQILLVSLDSLSGVSVKKCSSNCHWSINFNTSHGFESWVDHIIYEHQSDLKSNCSDRSIMVRSFSHLPVTWFWKIRRPCHWSKMVDFY